MPNDKFDPAEASGENATRGSRLLVLNEVSLNADGAIKEKDGQYEKQGGFFRKRVIIGNPKDQKPQEINLGERITLVLLKVRRKLVERGEKGKIIRQTNEHTSPKETVTLYESETNNKITGVASDLRTQFPQLRTVQIVYALLVQGSTVELVRFIVKGASLGMQEKQEGVTDFYAYLSSFSGDDHFYGFKTELSPVKVEAQQTFYVINFQRGEKLSETSYKMAMDHMRKVHESCVAVDTERAMRVVANATVEKDVEPVDEGIVDGDDAGAGVDINPDDIPF